MIKPQWYPFASLLGQAIGMFFIGLEYILRFPADDLLIDTLNCPFAYPLLKLVGVPIASYVHYPFLRDETRFSSAGTGTLSKSLKKAFYHPVLFYWWEASSRCADITMANSTWTYDRLIGLWRPTSGKRFRGNSSTSDFPANAPVLILYPPCDLAALRTFDVCQEREPTIFSLAQFRPEKNQLMQVEILAKLYKSRPEWRGHVRLIICGSCRNAADRSRADAIMHRAVQLGIGKDVSVLADVDHGAILEALSESTIGLHTMVEEHFGIGIVEMMAAGTIAVANASGGPLTDIIKGPGLEGFLCSTVEEYAETVEQILSMSEPARREIRERARRTVLDRFDSSIFEEKFIGSLIPLLPQAGKEADQVMKKSE